MRGIASLIVVFFHCMLGFWPEWAGIFPGFGPGLRATPIHGLVYGTAAVTFFFVLSGFVLTRRYFRTGREDIIVRGVVKRWPRLAGPAIVITVASLFLARQGFYHFSDVADLTGSPWLKNFGGFSAPPVHAEYTYAAALKQGALTFFSGDVWLNTNLWTMQYEFYGSMAAFGLGVILYRCGGSISSQLYLLAVACLACKYVSPSYVSFPVGVALAAFLPERSKDVPTWAAGAMIAAALYLLGYTRGAEGAYRWISSSALGGFSETYFQILASAVLIYAVEGSSCVRDVLSKRAFAVLGELSFPLYLVHMLVLCSAGCLVYRASPHSYAPAIASAATLSLALAAAYPILIFNRCWVGAVNHFTDRLPLFAETGARSRSPRPVEGALEANA